MNKQELILTMVAEEASEVAKEASKCLRFTPGNEHNGESNYVRLLKEWNELSAMMLLLRATMLESEVISPTSNQEAEWYNGKLERFEEFKAISQALGAVDSDLSTELKSQAEHKCELDGIEYTLTRKEYDDDDNSRSCDGCAADSVAGMCARIDNCMPPDARDANFIWIKSN